MPSSDRTATRQPSIAQGAGDGTTKVPASLGAPAGAAISVEGLTMTFRAPVRAAGLGAALRSLARREYRSVEAVRAISFAVEPGEVVGFIGPNGAGKTTTLKMLSGVLQPTSGGSTVLGFTPWRRDHRYLRQIAMVRGSRPLGGPPELTVLDALRFQQLIYEVRDGDFRRNLAELVELLDLDAILQRQVRALSLGERMRAGLASSLVYRPRVLFLDEPTIGLDVSATVLIRRFIADYARQTGATVLLTSHSMRDVESLCRRIILVDEGRLRYDGDLAGLAARLAPYKLVHVASGASRDDWSGFGDVVANDGARITLRVARADVPAVTSRLLTEVVVEDLSVEEPSLEDVLVRVYREGVTA